MRSGDERAGVDRATCNQTWRTASWSWPWTAPSKGWTWTRSPWTTKRAPTRVSDGCWTRATGASRRWPWTSASGPWRGVSLRIANALGAAGLPVDEALISTEHDPAQARAALRRMLAGDDPPTAVLATNHMAGRTAMRAMREAGAQMAALAVFDSMDDNDLLATPPLVVVASGPDRIGRLAAELAVERLDGLQAPPRPRTLILSLRLPSIAIGASDR